MTQALTIRDLHVTYPGRGRGDEASIHAVRGVDVEITSGEILAILGASGCGKSSLLRAVAGLEPRMEGVVSVAGRDVSRLPIHRRKIGMVFQSPQLFPHRNVGRNVSYGLEGANTILPSLLNPRRREQEELAKQWLAFVGLAGYEKRPISTLSGGQAQRVALARALAPSPEILLLDEPLSALDRLLREELARDLRAILRKAGVAALYVTHDHSEAIAVADRIAIMDEGSFIAIGTPAELFSCLDPRVRAFLKADQAVRARVERKSPDSGAWQVCICESIVRLPGNFHENQEILLPLGEGFDV